MGFGANLVESHRFRYDKCYGYASGQTSHKPDRVMVIAAGRAECALASGKPAGATIVPQNPRRRSASAQPHPGHGSAPWPLRAAGRRRSRCPRPVRCPPSLEYQHLADVCNGQFRGCKGGIDRRKRLSASLILGVEFRGAHSIFYLHSMFKLEIINILMFCMLTFSAAMPS